MKPIPFKQQNIVYAEDQPEYQPLPAWHDGVETVSRWQFTFWERIRILFGCNLWLHQMNCGRLLQPQLPCLDDPFVVNDDELDDLTHEGLKGQ